MRIDEELISAYMRTVYRTFEPPFAIRIGVMHPDLDAWLTALGKDDWAFITAWNPGSVPLSAEKNRERQKALEAMLTAGGWPCLRGLGEPSDPGWTPEESFLIAGMKEAEAILLGRKLGQNAVVVGKAGQAARLVWCIDEERKILE